MASWDYGEDVDTLFAELYDFWRFSDETISVPSYFQRLRGWLPG